MIYTSYFGNLSKLSKNIIPIAICGGIPSFYKGAWYKKLAPSWSIFSEWKYGKHDNDLYIKRFNAEILAKLDPKTVVGDLGQLTNYPEAVALICYEKPNEFCHRHLVAAWLKSAGYRVEEYNET